MKITNKIRKKFRVTNKVKKVSPKNRYRLSVSRSLKNISAQIIDDTNNVTLASVSSNKKEFKKQNKNKKELSTLVAEELAKKAKIEGADYVAFGPAFNSKTKKTSREVLDLDKLKKKNIGIPFTIIGGIDHSNIKKLFNIGANNFSLINSIWNFENGPVKSAIKYKELENIYEN